MTTDEFFEKVMPLYLGLRFGTSAQVQQLVLNLDMHQTLIDLRDAYGKESMGKFFDLAKEVDERIKEITNEKTEHTNGV